jgi:hypothetical protein
MCKRRLIRSLLSIDGTFTSNWYIQGPNIDIKFVSTDLLVWDQWNYLCWLLTHPTWFPCPDHWPESRFDVLVNQWRLSFSRQNEQFCKEITGISFQIRPKFSYLILHIKGGPTDRVSAAKIFPHSAFSRADISLTCLNPRCRFMSATKIACGLLSAKYKYISLAAGNGCSRIEHRWTDYVVRGSVTYFCCSLCGVGPLCD